MLINEIRDDLREECEKFGVVKKVLLFDVRRYTCTHVRVVHVIGLLVWLLSTLIV